MPDTWAYAATVLSLALAAYAATNIDNMLILTGLTLAGNPYPVVARGLVMASVILVLVIAAFMALDYFVPPALFGYLGLVPIFLGVRLLFAGDDNNEVGDVKWMTSGNVAMLLVGNSADTVATFAPLVAESERPARLLILAAFAVGVIALLVLVRMFSSKEGPVASLQKLAHRITPVVMILVGIYVLLNTNTDTVY